MKTFLTTMGFLLLITMFSCRKNRGTDNSQTLSLLQKNWSLVVRHGEVLNYRGTPADYYNFRADNILFRHLQNSSDTSFYTLLSNGSDISLYPIVNGIRSTVPTNIFINLISQSQLVISGGVSPSILFTDSLSR